MNLAAASVMMMLLFQMGGEKGTYKTARMALGLVFLLIVLEPAAKALGGGAG